MEQIDAIQNQIDAGKVKSFNMQRDREEAEEARRNEEDHYYYYLLHWFVG